MLAAGFSRRFGSSKLQTPLKDGLSILQHSINTVLQSTENIIIAGRVGLHQQGAYAFLQSKPPSPALQLVMCEDAESGMGHSLACAAQHIPNDWQAVLICLGDMPFIKPETLDAILAASAADAIVVPQWQGQSGHPVCFGRDYFTELSELHGDSGARALLQRHSAAVRYLPVDDPGILQDIDTPQALAELIGQSR